MKHILIFSLMLGAGSMVHAQDYVISFATEGDTSAIDSVIVEHIAKNISVTVPGGFQLKLIVSASGVNALENGSGNTLNVYPNPSTDQSMVECFIYCSGQAVFEVFDQAGRKMAEEWTFLEPGKQSYRISGLGSGVFTVRVISQDNIQTGKLISQSRHAGKVQVDYAGRTSALSAVKSLKSTPSEINMPYTPGDRLKITVIAGKYSTVYVDAPDKSKIISVRLTDCTDADNNHYAVVTIGTQTWMAENLKTTTLSDGTPIPSVSLTWANVSIPAYCWYQYSSAYGNVYGGLYNWYTVETDSLCPTGWHVPSDEDWTILEEHLGGYRVAGGKLKDARTTLWGEKNVATNETGFTALPGGIRDANGYFISVGLHGYWWTATLDENSYPWYKQMLATQEVLGPVPKYSFWRKGGLSVRCLKDE